MNKRSEAAKARHKKFPQPKGKNNPRYNQVVYSCDYCGCEANQHPSTYNRSKKHFCSRDCMNKYKTGENHHLKKSEYIEFDCTECGIRSSQKRINFDLLSDNHFCSRKCYADNLSRTRSGINSHLWKGGVTKLRDSIRGCRDYRNWRTAVFEESNYTCYDCKQKGGYLEAHHIISFASIIFDNEIESLEDAYNTPILWDINNGKTYCKVCHDKQHGKETK